MPLLDLSDLIDDPDFAADPGTLFLVTTVSRVNDYGENETTMVRTPLAGVAMPASAEMLKRLPDLSRVEGAIVVYTKTKLSAQAGGSGPDRIEYLGALYTVTALANWTPYGVGFCGAVCTLTDVTTPAP